MSGSSYFAIGLYVVGVVPRKIWGHEQLTGDDGEAEDIMDLPCEACRISPARSMPNA